MPFTVITFSWTLLSNKTQTNYVVEEVWVSNVSKIGGQEKSTPEKVDQLSKKKKNTSHTLLIEICKNEKFNGKHENDSDCII